MGNNDIETMRSMIQRRKRKAPTPKRQLNIHVELDLFDRFDDIAQVICFKKRVSFSRPNALRVMVEDAIEKYYDPPVEVKTSAVDELSGSDNPF